MTQESFWSVCQSVSKSVSQSPGNSIFQVKCHLLGLAGSLIIRYGWRVRNMTLIVKKGSGQHCVYAIFSIRSGGLSKKLLSIANTKYI